MGLFLETLSALEEGSEIREWGCDLEISQPGANPPKMTALHGGHALVCLAPAWEAQLILRCFL